MIVLLSTKRGMVGINSDKVLFVGENNKGSRIELEDGTPIDVLEHINEVVTLLNPIITNFNTKN